MAITDFESEPTICPPEVAIPDNLGGQWWVAHTRSRNEKALARELQQLDIFNYLPLMQRVTRSKRTGKKSHSTVPIFSGYLFLNATDHERQRALSTNRIANMLFVAGQEQLVQQLRNVHRVIGIEAGFEQYNGIKIGEWVRVVGGPLLGVEGQIVQQLGKTRLAINVDILGQSVLAEVDADWLEAIEPPVPPVEPQRGRFIQH